MIARDSSSQGINESGSGSLVFSHTCSGSNRILFVSIQPNGNYSEVLTGVSYDGVAMTQIAKKQNGSGFVYLYYLLNPNTGTHNVVASRSGAYDIYGTSASYTGVKQSGQPDAYYSIQNTSNPITATLTTIADKCWTICCGTNNNYNLSASTGSNLLQNIYGGANILADSNGQITPAGSKSMSFTTNNSYGSALIMASFSPAPPEITNNFFPFF